jgi:hypothetical protein
VDPDLREQRITASPSRISTTVLATRGIAA